MPDPFADAMGFVWRPENDGQGFHNDPQDPGGATTWGVTFATWSAWETLHGRSAALSSFIGLGQDDLRALYRALFWNACCCGSMAPGVGLSVFDAAVGSAPQHAARFLQFVVGVPQDGAIGPVTLDATRVAGAARVIDQLCVQRELFYAQLPTFRIYGRGWDRRAEDCRKFARTMVPANV